MKLRRPIVPLLTAGLLIAALLGVAACDYGESRKVAAAEISAEEQARIDRVEKGLLPVNPLQGREGWSLGERMEAYHVPGLSLAVIEDFEIAWAKGYGLADVESEREVTVDTLFQAASLSKPVTAVGVLALAEQGELELDADIREYLESWRLQGSALGTREVTPRRLLSHSAGVTVYGFEGYPYDSELPTLAQVLEGSRPAANKPIRVDAPPGKAFQYSGGGYTILQQAMEDISGEPFPGLMRRLVLQPSRMSRSTFEQPLPADRLDEASFGYRRNGAPAGGRFHVYAALAAAGLWTTPTDLGRLVIDLQQGLRGEDGPVLHADSVREMMDPPVDGEVGLGIFLKGAKRAEGPYFMHSGANEGFRALLVGHTRGGYGAVVMANSDTAGELLQEVVRGVAREYGWKGFLPAPMAIVELSPEVASELPGRYEIGSDGVLIVTVKDDRVVGRVTLGRPFEMFPVGSDRFCREDTTTTYRFTGDGFLLEEKDGKKRTAMRLDGARRLPSEWIEAGAIDEAVAAYRRLQEERPQDLAASERRLNLTGYEAMGRGDLDLALTILEVNTRLYPDSANTYDSLAEAYWNAGRKEEAFRNYRKVLEKLPGDPGASPRMKDLLRKLAQEKLALAPGND